MMTFNPMDGYQQISHRNTCLEHNHLASKFCPACLQILGLSVPVDYRHWWLGVLKQAACCY